MKPLLIVYLLCETVAAAYAGGYIRLQKLEDGCEFVAGTAIVQEGREYALIKCEKYSEAIK